LSDIEAAITISDAVMQTTPDGQARRCGICAKQPDRPSAFPRRSPDQFPDRCPRTARNRRSEPIADVPLTAYVAQERCNHNGLRGISAARAAGNSTAADASGPTISGRWKPQPPVEDGCRDDTLDAVDHLNGRTRQDAASTPARFAAHMRDPQFRPMSSRRVCGPPDRWARGACVTVWR
jgi:hypothetical protein